MTMTKPRLKPSQLTPVERAVLRHLRYEPPKRCTVVHIVQALAPEYVHGEVAKAVRVLERHGLAYAHLGVWDLTSEGMLYAGL